MNIVNYEKYMEAEILMGPNSARILEELLAKDPLQLSSEKKVLDLGCGKGLTRISSAYWSVLIPIIILQRKRAFLKKILPFLCDNAAVLIGIPGIKDEYAGRSEELLPEWLGNEAYMFKSPMEWKEIIGRHERIEKIETWEMGCFDLAWNEWLATENQYASGDKRFYETIIKPYTCFVGIYVKIK